MTSSTTGGESLHNYIMYQYNWPCQVLSPVFVLPPRHEDYKDESRQLQSMLTAGFTDGVGRSPPSKRLSSTSLAGTKVFYMTQWSVHSHQKIGGIASMIVAAQIAPHLGSTAGASSPMTMEGDEEDGDFVRPDGMRFCISVRR